MKNAFKTLVCQLTPYFSNSEILWEQKISGRLITVCRYNFQSTKKFSVFSRQSSQSDMPDNALIHMGFCITDPVKVVLFVAHTYEVHVPALLMELLMALNKGDNVVSRAAQYTSLQEMIERKSW